MSFNFVDEEKLQFVFHGIVIDGDAINANIGLINKFVQENDLSGLTNGKIVMVCDMIYPSKYLNDLCVIMRSNGLIETKDFVFLEEQLTQGVERREDDYPSVIGQPIPGTKNLIWLESEITADGNWIWKSN